MFYVHFAVELENPLFHSPIRKFAKKLVEPESMIVKILTLLENCEATITSLSSAINYSMISMHSINMSNQTLMITRKEVQAEDMLMEFHPEQNKNAFHFPIKSTQMILNWRAFINKSRRRSRRVGCPAPIYFFSVVIFLSSVSN